MNRLRTEDDTTEWTNVLEEGASLPEGFWDDMPTPLFWRVLVLPVKPKEVSKGGIVLAKVHLDAQEILNYMGQVVALGPQAGKHERLGGDGVSPAAEFPKVGDFVIYGRYAGQQLMYKGMRILMVNDDELLGRVPSPSALTIRV